MTPDKFRLTDNVVTQSAIAEKCNVSIMTVSRALRGEACVTADTTARIRAVAEELGYNPAHNIAARRLAMRKCGQRVINHLVATLFPRDMRRVTFNAMLFDGVVDELAQQGYMLVAAVSPNPLEEQFLNGIPPLFSCGEIDALILNPNAKISAKFVSGLRKQPYFADRAIISLIYPMENCSNILVDGYQGAFEATKHLISLGHQDILRFEVPGSLTQAVRLAGIKQAYLDAGIDVNTHLHSVPMPPLWSEPGTLRGEFNHILESSETAKNVEIFIEYINAHPEVSAVMASNDCCAIQAFYHLQRLGLSVPDDISLIGFDDTDPLLNLHGENVLTTVRLPLEEVGRAAARLAIEQTESNSAELVEVILPTKLIVRKSTTVPRKRTAKYAMALS